MDSLDSLPVDEKSKNNPQDVEIMKKYFGDNVLHDKPDNTKYKIIAVVTLLFAVISNPITQGILYRLPFIEGNKIYTTVLSVLVFLISTILIMYTEII